MSETESVQSVQNSTGVEPTGVEPTGDIFIFGFYIAIILVLIIVFLFTKPKKHNLRYRPQYWPRIDNRQPSPSQYTGCGCSSDVDFRTSEVVDSIAYSPRRTPKEFQKPCAKSATSSSILTEQQDFKREF